MFLLYFLLWIIFNGRITVEIVIIGFLISAAISAFSYRVMGYSWGNNLRILRNLPLLVLYTLVLIKEIFKASFAVMKVILSGRKPDPVIVEFDSHLESQFQNVLLANSITLTPGTFTLLQEGDHFCVHCLDESYAQGMGECSFVQLLRRIH